MASGWGFKHFMNEWTQVSKQKNDTKPSVPKTSDDHFGMVHLN